MIWRVPSPLQRRPPDRGNGPLHLAAKKRATWRWSRCCSPPGHGSRRRTTTAAALRDGTDATGRMWCEGGATDFRIKFDGVHHLTGDEPPAHKSQRVDSLKEIRHIKLSLLGCTASERWSCTCTTLINLYWCKRAWCKVSSDSPVRFLVFPSFERSDHVWSVRSLGDLHKHQQW